MRPPLYFRRLRAMIPQLESELARKIIAVEAAKFHNENFRAQAWTETGKKWPPRKDQDTTRSLLVKTGRLRRAATTPRTRGQVVEFVMPIYGKVHNEGLTAGRGGKKMPRRQFLGPGRVLKDRIRAKSADYLNRRLNRL